MQGQFIFSTCAAAGLRMRALLRNGARGGEPVAAGANMAEMKVSLRVFHAGVLEYESASFASIPYGDYAEVSDDTCPILADQRKEYLLIAHRRRGDGDQYFAQEHQLTYDTGAGGRTTSLIYDQLPVASGKINSILLLSPKAWVSHDVDTFICVANVGNPRSDGMAGSSWQIEFLEQSGAIIHALSLDLAQNGSHLIDVKRELQGRLELSRQPKMLTVVARGATVGAVILTFLINRKTQAVALEHSLSPHYYMNGDFSRVRREAFLFPRLKGAAS
jgi:hypothetical protein